MAYNPQNPNGQATSANSSPVVIASDQSAIPITQTTASNLKIDLSGTGANTTSINVTEANSASILNQGTTTATNTTGLNNSVGTTGSALPSKGIVVQGSDGTNARNIKVDTNGTVNINGYVFPVSNSLFGTNVKSGSGNATAVIVKGSFGTVQGWYIFNPNTSQVYVNFYDNASAASGLLFSIGVPALGGANVSFPQGIQFGNGIVITCSAGRNNSTNPSSTVDYNIFYT